MVYLLTDYPTIYLFLHSPFFGLMDQLNHLPVLIHSLICPTTALFHTYLLLYLPVLPWLLPLSLNNHPSTHLYSSMFTTHSSTHWILSIHLPKTLEIEKASCSKDTEMNKEEVLLLGPDSYNTL